MGQLGLLYIGLIHTSHLCIGQIDLYIWASFIQVGYILANYMLATFIQASYIWATFTQVKWPMGPFASQLYIGKMGQLCVGQICWLFVKTMDQCYMRKLGHLQCGSPIYVHDWLPLEASFYVS